LGGEESPFGSRTLAGWTPAQGRSDGGRVGRLDADPRSDKIYEGGDFVTSPGGAAFERSPPSVTS